MTATRLTPADLAAFLREQARRNVYACTPPPPMRTFSGVTSYDPQCEPDEHEEGPR